MSIRILCLGNEILADDAFGMAVAAQIRQVSPVEVVESSLSGFNLLDYIQDVSCLIVIDTVQTGTAEPGTVFVFCEEDLESVPGGSPHYIGLFEALRLARKLQQNVPGEVVILAVEAADCWTLGGPMHPAVQAAVPVVVNMVQQIIRASGRRNPSLDGWHFPQRFLPGASSFPGQPRCA